MDARLGAAHTAPAIGSPLFERALDKATGSVSRSPCDVTPLFDGPQAFGERLRMLDAAKTSVHIQTYRITDDETGWALAKKLVEKAQQGVPVRFIYDAIGSLPADRALFDYMKAGGVQVRQRAADLLDPLALNDRWHEKHFIVDGEESIEGGMNLADEYAFGGTDRRCTHHANEGAEGFRDVDVLLRGEVVHDAQRAFLKNWATLGPPVPDEELHALFPTPEVEDGAAVRFVQHRPKDDGDDHTHQLMLQCIRSATTSITIENAYFLPPKDLRDALIEAARRGVLVRVMTNSVESNNHGFVSECARYFYADMIAAGVGIYERVGPPCLHAKTAEFDGVFSMIGSCNLNGRSKDRDSECTVCTDDQDCARSLRERFDSGLGACLLVTPAHLDGDGFFRSMKQWALSTLAWTF